MRREGSNIVGITPPKVANDLAPGAGREWLGNSVWQAPKVEISGIKAWASITAVSYYRNAGEAISRGARHRVVLTPHQLSSRLLQVEQGHTRQTALTPPGSLTFCPADLTIRSVLPAARLIQVAWDTDLYSALLPELGAAAPRFEYLYPLQDSLLSQIVTSLAQAIDGGFAERILVESLGTALCIRIARLFVGHFPLPTSKGLSPERLQRVRDYVEAHLNEDRLSPSSPTSPVSAPITSAARSSRRRASGYIITSCNAGSNGRRP